MRLIFISLRNQTQTQQKFGNNEKDDTVNLLFKNIWNNANAAHVDTCQESKPST